MTIRDKIVRQPEDAGTTIDTITDEQIKQLMTEAGAAGDLMQVAVCRVALATALHEIADIDDIEGAWSHLESIGIYAARVDASDLARAECVRVIRDAEAQNDLLEASQDAPNVEAASPTPTTPIVEPAAHQPATVAEFRHLLTFVQNYCPVRVQDEIRALLARPDTQPSREAELAFALRAVLGCLETHIADEAKAAGVAPERFCPCHEVEIAHARAVLARTK